MRSRPVVIALGLVVLAVVLQTTIFAPGNIQPFGAAPNLVLLVVIGCARYLDPEPALLVGFTGGLLVDLLSSSPLGLWAMVLTAVTFLTLKVRRRATDGPVAIAAGVFALTLIGQVLFVFAGTLFGQKTIEDPEVLRKLFLPALYNLILAPPVFWGIRAALRPRERSWAL